MFDESDDAKLKIRKENEKAASRCQREVTERSPGLGIRTAHCRELVPLTGRPNAPRKILADDLSRSLSKARLCV